MKTLVSLAVALTVIPAAAGSAGSAGTPEASEASMERVAHLGHAARTHARRLGLAIPPPARAASSPDAVARQERRLADVVGFLSIRREVHAPRDERARPARAPRARGLARRIGRQYTRAAHLTVALGMSRPGRLVLERGTAARQRQLAHWSAVAGWLAARSEVRKHAELPLSRRIPHYGALTCIAGYESHGAWDTDTGNGYYGGLQMDRGFQRTYAPRLYRTKGTADHWTRAEQMHAAERAIAARGFSPWPNTAAMCGLL
jgi:hypothetical protein